MARFMGVVEGGRQPVSRLGNANSGIRAQAQGWTAGVQVNGHPDDAGSEQHCFYVRLTGGSNEARPSFPLGVLRQAPNGKRYFHMSEAAIEAIKVGTNVIELDD